MIDGVKFSSIVLSVISTALCLTSVSCKPQAPDLERQRVVESHNQKLSEEIAAMRQRIRQAGEITPGLREQIETGRNNVREALARKEELRRQETATKLRYIELETRWNQFRATFDDLKSRAAANQS